MEWRGVAYTKTIACILVLSIVLQSQAADFSSEALALPQWAFHQPKIVKLLKSTLQSKIGKMGFLGVLLPSLAHAHEFFLDKAGNLMVHFDAWNKATPAQNTIGGVGVDILKATGEHVTWPGITKAMTHLETQTPLAGHDYSITGLPAEAISKLVKAVTKVSKEVTKTLQPEHHAPTIGPTIEPHAAFQHMYDLITKPWMEIQGYYRGGLYVALHQAKEDPFNPAFGWQYMGPPDLHASAISFPMHETAFWPYMLPHLVPYIIAGLAIVAIFLGWKYFRKHVGKVAVASIPLMLAMKAFGAGCDGPGCYSRWDDIKNPFMTTGGQPPHFWASLHEARIDPFTPAFTYELPVAGPPPPDMHTIEGFWKIPVQMYHAWSTMPIENQIFLVAMGIIGIAIVITIFTPKNRLERMLLKHPGIDSLYHQLRFIRENGNWKLVRLVKSFRGSENAMLRYALPQVLRLVNNKEEVFNRSLWMTGATEARAKLIEPHYGNVWHEPEGYYEHHPDDYNGMISNAYSDFIETKSGYFAWEWIDSDKNKRIALDKAIARFSRRTSRSS